MVISSRVAWHSGEVFDSTWSRRPSSAYTVGIGQLIPGLEELFGTPTGSDHRGPQLAFGSRNPEISIPEEETVIYMTFWAATEQVAPQDAGPARLAHGGR